MALETSEDRFNGVLASLAIKAPCIAVQTSPLADLEDLLVVDGFQTAEGDRVLVVNQADPIENGIYNASTSAWSRTPDFDGNRDITRGTIVNVNRSIGTSAIYEVTTLIDLIKVGVDPVNFRLWYDSAAAGIASGVDKFADLTDVSPVHDFMFVGTNIDCAENPFERFTVQHQVITSGGINEITLDYELGQDIFYEMTEFVVTVNFINLPPSGTLAQFEMHLLQDSIARTISWPASVKWMNGVEIDISNTTNIYLIHFRSIDGGTTWLATYARAFA